MNQYQRAKLNKILLIVAIVLAIIAIIVGVIFFISKGKSKNKTSDYEDVIAAQSLFEIITIDKTNGEIKRDGEITNLKDSLGIGDTQVLAIINSIEQLKEFFANSSIQVSENQNEVILKDPYQTKNIIIEADQIKDDFDAIETIEICDGIYVLKYDTEKRTKLAYEYLKEQSWIKNIEPDQVKKVEKIEDVSQTVYGQESAEGNENTNGISAMGIKKYKSAIETLGSAQDVTVATIGYGGAIDNTYFNNRISEHYYNFIDNSTEVKETLPQGSRILEVIKEATTDNVKIMPLVVINENNYTTLSSILLAIARATQQSDVICYEFIHDSSELIKKALKSAFDAGIPVCCVTNANSNVEMFPASDATTIAVSSVDKDKKTTSYSAVGDYIDFVASSTDVKEIFNNSSSVSMWSGAEYSNAHIAAIVALYKTYNKEAKVLDVYEFIRNFCEDLGENGKDNTYGYGLPNFSNIKLSSIDKVGPQITELVVDDTNWEKTKKVKIKASENIKIFGWAITKTEESPKEWKKSDNVLQTLETTEEIEENGTYYLWVADLAGNADRKSFTISKIDRKEPEISHTVDTSKLESEKTVTINVTAKDDESGLDSMPYSWDNLNWGTNNTILKVTSNGTYTIYVRDKLGNMATKEISIKELPEKGKAEIDTGLIIKDISVSDKWEGNVNKEVTITFNNDLNIKRRKLTTTDLMPEEFRPVQSEPTNMVSNTTNTIVNNTISNNTVTNNITATPTVTPTPTSGNVVTPIIDDGMQGYANLTVTVSLEIGKKYYIWIEDSTGNVISQGFTIKKSE